MPIDWFTVGAQTINFLVLVWLMKRFLYRPILDAIDAREQRIAAELASADARKAEALREHEEFTRKNDEFDRQRTALLRQATEEARTERQRLLEESRQAADDLRARREEALIREHQRIHSEITRRTREEIFAIARKTLADLAGANLEEHMCESFIRQLRQLNSETRDGLATALKNVSAPLLVRSRFDLSSDQQEAIRTSVHEILTTRLQIHFETSADVIAGIELTVNGRKLAWSVADYLESMENSIEELVQDPSQAAAKAGFNTRSERQSATGKADP